MDDLGRVARIPDLVACEQMRTKAFAIHSLEGINDMLATTKNVIKSTNCSKYIEQTAIEHQLRAITL